MSQLAENLKTAKLTFKSVLELAYEKDPDMVDRLISELIEAKPAKQSNVKKALTEEEKEQRKNSREAKKAHIDKFILDNGGEESVTQKQIQEEKKKYDKEKKSVASPFWIYCRHIAFFRTSRHKWPWTFTTGGSWLNQMAFPKRF